MRPDLSAYIGKRVQATIDRPLGSRHPREPDMVYPVNYGYLPNTLSGDGQPIDVYVLGVNVPVESAEGVVIAIVLRADDDEDKLVVAPEGLSYSAEEIAELVKFQERFFDSQVVTNHKEAKSAKFAKESSMNEQDDVPTVLLLCTDLMFGVPLQNMVKKAGLRHVNVRPGAPIPDAALMVVDLAARTDVPAAIRDATAKGVSVVAFGPHMDAEARKAAKEAGAERVLANSNLERDLPTILALLTSEE